MCFTYHEQSSRQSVRRFNRFWHLPRKWATPSASKIRSASYPDETTDPRIVANKEKIGPLMKRPRGIGQDK
ncbi:hypothetical protein N7447_010860 [Penicillium robsamsonii]|uniref:uncharacterized protein n=1 Tax=Penicillium robsamsonii TaxID=1792511 RepID=UPI002546BA3E|nr:uncharacterized protein N7447_010860 [Penicillium robsamsonii]KAJ5807404.1 hypothetical protein N7447_010860 [Penicillium robsamsonii]